MDFPYISFAKMIQNKILNEIKIIHKTILGKLVRKKKRNYLYFIKKKKMYKQRVVLSIK